MIRCGECRFPQPEGYLGPNCYCCGRRLPETVPLEYASVDNGVAQSHSDEGRCDRCNSSVDDTYPWTNLRYFPGLTFCSFECAIKGEP